MADGGTTSATQIAVLSRKDDDSAPDSTSDDGADGSSDPDAAPASGPRRGRFWRLAIPVLAVLALIGVVALSWYGKEAVLNSSSGRTFKVVDDPTAPGYEVLVSATETLLALQVDDDGSLAAVTFLSLPNESTGAGLFIPPDAVVDDPELGPMSLADLYESGGAAAVTGAVESILGIGIADYSDDGVLREGQVEEVDSARLEGLVAPVSPLSFDNPDSVVTTDADGATVAEFPQGEIALDAADAGPYLAARVPGENDLNRLARHDALWTAWVEAIRADGSPEAIAGETESGLGRFLSVFSSGDTALEVAPATTFGIVGVDGDLYLVETDVLRPWVASVVPFPLGPTPGDRTTLRVLDGTGTAGAALAAAQKLVAAGGEIRVIGNAPGFDYVGTQVLYHAPEHAERAQEIADAMGGASAELVERPNEVVMVTVIVGTEAVDELGLEQ